MHRRRDEPPRLAEVRGLRGRRGRRCRRSTSAGAAGRRRAGKAEACIFLWLGGGAAQIDTFDPKRRGDGKKKAGLVLRRDPDGHRQACRSASTCRGVARPARPLRRSSARSTTRSSTSTPRPPTCVHTGRPVSGTIVYPSLGSIVAHERGPGGDGVPAYVVIGYPNVTPRARLPRLEVRLRLPDRHRRRARPA